MVESNQPGSLAEITSALQDLSLGDDPEVDLFEHVRLPSKRTQFYQGYVP